MRLPDRRLARVIGTLAVEALLAEAALSPKPGLVTPFSPGAHQDMDFPLLVASARALGPCFEACAGAGLDAVACGRPLLLEDLRPLGLAGERAMFRATGGVNTHKGAIFALGLLSASLAFAQAEGCGSGLGDAACRRVARMCEGLVRQELSDAAVARSAGQRLYRDHGVRGARGQAEDGYPLLREQLLPRLRSALPRGHEAFAAACLDVLLLAMAGLEDSCLLHRGGKDGLRAARRGAAKVLQLGGAGTMPGHRALCALDRAISRAGLSPGGSADMLAAAIFLAKAEQLLTDCARYRRNNLRIA